MKFASFIYSLAFLLLVDGSNDVESKGISRYISVMQSKGSILHDINADGGGSSPEVQNGNGKEISSVDDRSSKSPKIFKHISGPSNDKFDAVKDEHDHVEQVTVISSVKHGSTPNTVSGQFVKTADVEQAKLLSVETDLHSPSRQDMDLRESRCADLNLVTFSTDCHAVFVCQRNSGYTYQSFVLLIL